VESPSGGRLEEKRYIDIVVQKGIHKQQGMHGVQCRRRVEARKLQAAQKMRYKDEEVEVYEYIVPGFVAVVSDSLRGWNGGVGFSRGRQDNRQELLVIERYHSVPVRIKTLEGLGERLDNDACTDKSIKGHTSSRTTTV